MKKLLFLLFFIPLMSFSQEIKFDDIMSINSVDTFKRVVIENLFELYNEDESSVEYGFDITRDKKEGDKAPKWAMYEKESDGFFFQFVKGGAFIDLEFNKIVSDIKSKCEYAEIFKEYVIYNCPDSSFEGQIGFKTSEGSSFVSMFPFFSID